MKIKFSDESLSDLKDIEEYLLEKWSDTIFEDFLEKLDNIVSLICEGNITFQNYEGTKYHKVMITKHNTLIYIVENDILKIIKILQNFKDPDKNYQSIQP